MNGQSLAGTLLKTALVIAAIVGMSNAQASLIIQPISATATATRAASGTQYFADNLINQSGLSADYTSGVTDFDTFIASSPTHSANVAAKIWATPNDVTMAMLDFNLGGEFLLDAFALWNRYAGFENQIGNFELLAADNAGFSGAVSLGSFTSTPTGTNLASGVEVFSFAPTTAAFIRLNITSAQPGGILLSAGEIAFRGDLAPIPEPATLSLLSLSLVGLGWARRKFAQ